MESLKQSFQNEKVSLKEGHTKKENQLSVEIVSLTKQRDEQQEKSFNRSWFFFFFLTFSLFSLFTSLVSSQNEELENLKLLSNENLAVKSKVEETLTALKKLQLESVKLEESYKKKQSFEKNITMKFKAFFLICFSF